MTVSLLRRDMRYPVATLQGPTGWVSHEPGEYLVAVDCLFKAEAIGGRIVPSVRLVSVDTEPRVSWTSEGIIGANNPPQLIPGHARYVSGWSISTPATGILIEWFAGQVPRFPGLPATRLRTGARTAVPDGATHFAQITTNTAFSFE